MLKFPPEKISNKVLTIKKFPMFLNENVNKNFLNVVLFSYQKV